MIGLLLLDWEMGLNNLIWIHMLWKCTQGLFSYQFEWRLKPTFSQVYIYMGLFFYLSFILVQLARSNPFLGLNISTNKHKLHTEFLYPIQWPIVAIRALPRSFSLSTDRMDINKYGSDQYCLVANPYISIRSVGSEKLLGKACLALMYELYFLQVTVAITYHTMAINDLWS